MEGICTCLARKYLTPDATMRKEAGPCQRSCLVQQFLHPAKAIRGWRWKLHHQVSEDTTEVAPSRINTPICTGGRNPGWLSRTLRDNSSCCPGHLSRFRVAPPITAHERPSDYQHLILLSFSPFFASRSVNMEAARLEEPRAACTCHRGGCHSTDLCTLEQERHRAVQPSPSKGCIVLIPTLWETAPHMPPRTPPLWFTLHLKLVTINLNY